MHSIPFCTSKLARVFPYTPLYGSQQKRTGWLIQLNGSKMASFMKQIHFWDFSQLVLEGNAKINAVGCHMRCILKRKMHSSQCIPKSTHSRNFLKSLLYDCSVSSFSWNRGLGLFSQPLSLALCTGLHDITCMTCCLEDNFVTCTAIMDHSVQSDCWAYLKR